MIGHDNIFYLDGNDNLKKHLKVDMWCDSTNYEANKTSKLICQYTYK